jgi:hypothetical protein
VSQDPHPVVPIEQVIAVLADRKPALRLRRWEPPQHSTGWTEYYRRKRRQQKDKRHHG